MEAASCDIDGLLDDLLLGSSVVETHAGPEGSLPFDHQFSWQSLLVEPKADHGQVVAGRADGRFLRDVTYSTLHTGGFLRLCTDRGRIYWNAQNESGHRTADWKFHFSVELEDVPAAWNAIASLFMSMRCDYGMKAVEMSPESWSEGQRGREITVYLFVFDLSYKGYMQGVMPELDPSIWLGQEFDAVFGAVHWFTFIAEAERRLSALGVRSRGCARGDLALPNCKYASLRNEAFVKIDKDFVYPPNDSGWNGARHRVPQSLLELIFFLRQMEKAEKLK